MSNTGIEIDPATVKFSCEFEDLLFGYSVIIGVPVTGDAVVEVEWPKQRKKALKKALKKCHDPFVSGQIVQEIRGEEVERRVDLRPYFEH